MRSSEVQSLSKPIIAESASGEAQKYVFHNSVRLSPVVDLTGSFCTKRFVRNGLGKEHCYAEEAV